MCTTIRRTFRPCLECFESRLAPAKYTVTNLLDNGSAGSLRMRVVAANNHAGADTVVFKAGLQGTIKLTRGQIPISDSLVLTGPGATNLAVNGGGFDRIFLVSSPADIKVTIEGLKLRNGDAGFMSLGGAIYSSENLTLNKMTLSGNQAGLDGGAVTAYGVLVIRQSTISGKNATAGNGGGVFFDGSALTVVRSTISGNRAAASGGGLFVGISVSTATIKDSTIGGNRADAGQGGGVRTQSSMTVKNTKIINNVASSSGGGIASLESLTIDRCTISGNTSSQGGRGGGIRTAGLKLTNSTVSGNHADLSQGGGIFVDQASSASITRCTIANNSAAEGGGLFTADTYMSIHRAVIRGNKALNGNGGGGVQTGGRLWLTNSTLHGNKAMNLGDGGAILLENTAAQSIIQGCTFSANTTEDHGGGLQIANSNHVLIRNSTFSGNRADGSGGAIRVFANLAPLTIDNSTIAFNEAGAGGGIWADQTQVDLRSCIVARNQAVAGRDLYGGDPIARFWAFYSLIGTDDDAVETFDQTSLALRGKNPRLAPLANNGGPTKTHALQKGSPALNKGENSAALKTDQRGPGFKRKVGGVDIGAFEVQ
jgi:hypothetical protein